jgi:ketopantoate reductase
MTPEVHGRRAINDGAMRRISAWGQDFRFPLPIFPNSGFQSTNVVFTAVKAFDLQAAWDYAVPKVPAGSVVIAVSNGAIQDIVRDFSQRFPKLVFRSGYCMFGTSQISAECYALTSHSSKLVFGPLMDSLTTGITAAEETFVGKDLGNFFEFRQDVEVGIVRKWIFNTVMNSICASRRLSCNSALLDDEAFLEAVFLEAFRLHHRLWPWSPLEVNQTLRELRSFIADTGANENSMARDMRLGRRTESIFLAGKALKFKEFPILQQLHRLCDPNWRDSI